MKISGVGPNGAPSSTRRTGKATGGDGFARALRDATGGDGGDDDAASVDGAIGLSGIESLLALQAVNPDGGGRGRSRQRMLQRGNDLLDLLESVRRGLLAGAIPRDRLTALAQLVRQRRDAETDPQLSAILDEIELRAEVELAKLARR